MKVISFLDIAVFGAFGFIFVLGLLLYGRPWIINSTVKTVTTSYEKAVSKFPGTPGYEIKAEPILTSITPKIKKKNYSQNKTNKLSHIEPSLSKKVVHRRTKG